MTLLARVLIGPIRVYQRWISPLLPRHCRYEPTCSQFMVEAITKHGPVRGLGMGIHRIGRCHPWSEGGFDPVPDTHPRRAV